MEEEEEKDRGEMEEGGEGRGERRMEVGGSEGRLRCAGRCSRCAVRPARRKQGQRQRQRWPCSWRETERQREMVERWLREREMEMVERERDGDG
jgi:hypothetical protein